jgi:DNA-binding NarL/FixJ family response regulator
VSDWAAVGRPPRNRTTVVLAGPDRDFLETARKVVDARPPFEVVAVAGTDEEAFAAAESHEPSIVLMESSGRGGETIQMLHGLSSSPAVVLVTSAESVNGSAPGYEQGADAYMEKSSDLASIIDVVLAFALQRQLAS